MKMDILDEVRSRENNMSRANNRTRVENDKTFHDGSNGHGRSRN